MTTSTPTAKRERTGALAMIGTAGLVAYVALLPVQRGWGAGRDEAGRSLLVLLGLKARAERARA